MRFLFSFILFLAFAATVLGQKNLDRTLNLLNSETVPYVYVNEINTLENIVILDTRKKEEFEVSHLKNAIWVGYEVFESKKVTFHVNDKDTPIIVYCSIGVRSEDIGEKLQKAGYTNVKNLYGGIFAWKNQDKKVYNTTAIATDSVHAFDKQWGKLLKKGIKIYTVD
jgi:rhodanese-related sulfurtransferase